MAATHVVSQGECIATIVRKYGFKKWNTVWDHPRNARLKDQRKNPNILFPGDEIFIPDLNVGQYARATGSRHTFQREAAPPVKLRLQLVDGRGKAYADASYTLEVHDASGEPVVRKNGKTPANGLVEAVVPDNACSGRVSLVPNGAEFGKALEWQLHLGHLDPLHEVAGAQSRLSNLGIPVGERTGAITNQMKAALLSFQELHGLRETGELDAATLRTLEDLHDKLT